MVQPTHGQRDMNCLGTTIEKELVWCGLQVVEGNTSNLSATFKWSARHNLQLVGRVQPTDSQSYASCKGLTEEATQYHGFRMAGGASHMSATIEGAVVAQITSG